jgi:hypothetical protein
MPLLLGRRQRGIEPRPEFRSMCPAKLSGSVVWDEVPAVRAQVLVHVDDDELAKREALGVDAGRQ